MQRSFTPKGLHIKAQGRERQRAHPGSGAQLQTSGRRGLRCAQLIDDVSRKHKDAKVFYPKGVTYQSPGSRAPASAPWVRGATANIRKARTPLCTTDR